MAEKRSALIIANSRYEDMVLRQLVAPAQDAEALAEVLQDPAICDFEVQTLSNSPSYKVCETIEAFFDDRERDHLLLLYFSGHGVTDDDGMLYFATCNTQRKRLRSTAVGAKWVNEIMIQCRSRRQVLLLDCCHSGAFARAKAADAVSTGQQFEASTREAGRGRVVLTASDAMQYSFEGDAVEGQGVRSVFTQALVDGLKTGEADLDGDGQIKLDELYSYVHRRVKDKTPQQSPRRWDFDVEGEIIIAQNPRPIAAQLPDDLQHAISSFVPEAREAAVLRLGGLLLGKHKGLALAARNALLSLKEDDSRRVSGAAEKCLAAYSEQLTRDEKAVGEKTPVAQPLSLKIEEPVLTEKKRIEHGLEPTGIEAESRGAEEIKVERTPPEKEQQSRLRPVDGEAKPPEARKIEEKPRAQQKPGLSSDFEPAVAVPALATEGDSREFANLIGVRSRSIDWPKGLAFLGSRLAEVLALQISYLFSFASAVSFAYVATSLVGSTVFWLQVLQVCVSTPAILASFRWIRNVVGAAVVAGFVVAISVITVNLITDRALNVTFNPVDSYRTYLRPFAYGLAYTIGLSCAVRRVRPLWLGLMVGTVGALETDRLLWLIDGETGQGIADIVMAKGFWFGIFYDLTAGAVFSFCFWGWLRWLAKKRKLGSELTTGQVLNLR